MKDSTRPYWTHPYWTADEAFAFFEARTNLEKADGRLRDYRIERMEELVAQLGNPHRGIPTVHIAGSKGKGSVAMYLATVLAHHGFTVGLYTSPHILDYRERIQVLRPPESSPAFSNSAGPDTTPHAGGIKPGTTTAGGRNSGTITASDESRELPDLRVGPIEDAVIAEEAWKLRTLVQNQQIAGIAEEDLPTTFELLTVLAFLVFRRTKVQWMVLETGLGGRLDATNVCVPAATIITRIELEHTEYLGDTLYKIAREKAGILKAGVPAIVADQTPEAFQAIKEKATAVDAPLVVPEENGSRPVSLTTTSAQILPNHQLTNAALVVTCMESLDQSGLLNLSRSRLASGLRATTLPGRGQIIRIFRTDLEIPVVLDGAHTPESVAALVKTVSSQIGPKGVVVFGSVRGKNHVDMVRALTSWAVDVVVTRPGSFKSSDPAKLLAQWRDVGKSRLIGARIEPYGRSTGSDGRSLGSNREPPGHVGNTQEYSSKRPVVYAAAADVAWAAALGYSRDSGGLPVLVTGSFYLVAEILRAMVRYSYEDGHALSGIGWRHHSTEG